jgi:hypothetical protein
VTYLLIVLEDLGVLLLQVDGVGEGQDLLAELQILAVARHRLGVGRGRACIEQQKSH